jgi:hypothetical protein
MILNRTNLIARILALIRDNIRGEISASQLRAVLTDVTDSFPNLLSDRIGLPMLAEDVLAVLGGGIDPAKYQGSWAPGTNTPTIPAASGPNTGNWYLAVSAGTATGNAAGTYTSGDRIRSNGTIWQRMPAPPTIIADGSVVWEKLASEIRDLMAPTFSPEFVYALVDSNSRVALGVRPDGSLFGRWSIDDGSVTTSKISDASVTLTKLASSVTAAMAVETPTTFAGGYELTYAIVDTAGRVAFGVKADGSLVGKLPIDDGSVTTPKLAAASVTRAKLEAELATTIPETMDRPDYVYVLLDAQNRIAFGVKTDGSLVGKLPLADGVVTRTKLAASVGEVLPEDLSEATGYLYTILDASGRIGFGIRTDGTIVGKVPVADNAITTSKLASGAVTESRLASEVLRVFRPSLADRVLVEDDDDGWRGRTFDIPCTTGTDGSLFVPFASTPTRSIRGVNSTGTTLEFRRSAGLVIRGTRYRGTWTPGSGSPDAAPLPGDWWNVTASGTFAGLTWTNGDRLVALGTAAGLGAQWVKGLAGELFYCGEFNPVSHTPAVIRDGDLWQASVSGVFAGVTFLANDLLIREAGTWGRIASDPVSTVAAGAFYSFPVSNARQVEARRQDKGSTRVGILARGLRTTKARRSSDAIVMWGDSMVSTGGLDAAISALVAPRTFTGISYPGSQSAQILAMIQMEVRGADAYRGRIQVFFHATNNLLDLAQVRTAAFAMADLAGARDNRVLFLSVIGQLVMQWNGSRLACDQLEQAKAGTNAISDLEAWYEAAFPGQLVNSRAELLTRCAARTTPSLHFPGMTEGAVAMAYGILPLSFFFNFAAVPWSAGALTFQGYRSAAGLPSGGSDGDYWLRTGGGTVGALIVRWAGTWSEHTYDVTHMTTTGNQVLAQAFADFLTNNSL